MDQVNLFVVFIEGILSFLSPCILPILPVYLTILSGSTTEELENGQGSGKRLLGNTLLFILGISTAFFVLGASITALNQFLFRNKTFILTIGGLLIILLGVFYMGYLKIPFLQRERKIHLQVKKMNPITAFLLGFVFSFGWTPCIGPMLASVLIMASGAQTAVTGNLLIAVYSLGFMIPFLAIALSYKKVFTLLDKFKVHMDMIQKVGGIILVVSGVLMVLGGAAKVRGEVFDFFTFPKTKIESTKTPVATPVTTPPPVIPAPDFTLVDQNGNEHKLSDYKGKTVFLNFWATWCPPCKKEMPFIEELYKEYGENKEDVVILGVAMPEMGREGDREHITKFLDDANYTFPVIMDQTDNKELKDTDMLAYQYAITAFPTTFMINKEGNVAFYVPGGMEKDTMKQIIEEVKASVE